MSHTFEARRAPGSRLRALVRAAALVAAAGGLAAASPAYAEPVKAGPALPDELAVLTIGGAATPAAYRTDQVAVNRVSTATGAYRGRIVFPTTGIAPITIATQGPTTPLRSRTLRRSVDGRFLTFTGLRAAANLSNQDANFSTAVRVAADGTYIATSFGAGYMTSTAQESVGTVTVDGSRYWTGVSITKPLATIAPGDAALTQVAAPLSSSITTNSVDIVDGSLVATASTGVYRRPGMLPIAADTTTALQPLIPVSDAFDSVFVDTDGVSGADTAYVTRATRGLSKYVLDGGTWAYRGRVPGSFAWVAARAVDGAVELYASDSGNRRVLKLVDTAPVGGEIATTGATTLALAPSGVRFAGVAFAPGAGFPADATPYPDTPPAIYASATSLDTHLGASPKASVTLDVTDPNTPTSELAITAASSNPTVLPADKVEIAGTGDRRTVAVDPQAVGSANVTITVKAPDGQQATATIAVKATGPSPEATGHYYSGVVDLSADIDVGNGYFLGISDEVNTVQLYKAGVSGAPLASFNQGFPGGETDFEGATRAGDLLIWTGSHGNNRSGAVKTERRFVAFTRITGSGAAVDLEWAGSYSGLWDQWKAWDASDGHGLGANYLKFNTAMVKNVIPNAPNGFNVEGLTMAPGSTTEAWFGMRAPTITGADGIERALILPVKNIDQLASGNVDAQLGQPIFLNLGGRSIRDIAKNAHDQYLIEAGTGDTDDSLKNWALYTWDGNPSHDPVFVNELPTDEVNIGAWEGIAHVPDPLVSGSRALLTADSGDTGLGKTYGQYVTIGEPVAGPATPTGVTATAKHGAIDLSWEPAARATRYFVKVKTASGAQAPGSPLFLDGTSVTLEGLTAGTEYTATVRAQNVATRSANSVAVKATPTQGARIPTTTTLEYVGQPLADRPAKVIATVSDPRANGTVQFFNDGLLLADAYLTDQIDSNSYRYRNTFKVVDGKAEINILGALSPGLANLQAKFTTSNPENFLSSDSTVTPVFLAFRPQLPRAEIVSVTGDRVVGGRMTFKLKLLGGKPSELYPQGVMSIELGSHVNGSAALTPLTGDTAESQYGSAFFDEDGEATFSTTSLVAGEHRISGWVPIYSYNFGSAVTDEIPVTIAPAAPAPDAPALKKTWVGMTVSGTRITTEPLTLTARVSDPTLAGTVQFFYNSNSNIGAPVPVVDGIATYTGRVPGANQVLFARFQPAANRATTVSATSQGVPLTRGDTTEPPLGPATATTTALQITGERVAGAPLTANVTVAPAATDDPYAARDTIGYVEVLEKGKPIGYAHVVAGKAVVELGSLAVGPHSIVARFVSSDERRAVSSASAAQAFDVVVKTDAQGSAGGTVPATLALTLGTPASFGAFAPGLARDYAASTTAAVVSTAGDAALTVADPSSTAAGHLVNGAFSLAQALQARAGGGSFASLGASSVTLKAYAAPTSNDVVTVDFKQSIGASEGLRTGQYGKTLTFTLSTTTP